MKNLLTITRALLFAACMTMAGCRSNMELYDARFASKMENYVKDTSLVKMGGVRMIPISTPKGNYKVWTKTVGNSKHIKVLLLGSGPGISHEYLQCLESYFPAKAISFIYYDPIGSGRSDNPSDTTLWNLARYTDEIEQVRLALKLNKDNFYLFAHGLGGMTAIEYALKYQNNLKALILSNTLSDSKAYNSFSNRLIQASLVSETPSTLGSGGSNADASGLPDYNMPGGFNSKHLCRLPTDQWEDPIKSFLSDRNDSIRIFMNGKDALKIFGKLAGWDRSQDLKRITVPTLLIGAKHDFMDPNHVKWMASQIKNATYLYCENGSHLAMYDDQDVYMEGITDFIYDSYRKDHFWDIYF